MKKYKDNSGMKLLLDGLPSILFFAAYWKFGIYVATAVLIVSILITTVLTIKVTGKFSWYGIIIALIALVGGSLTIYFHNETFVKMKVTVIESFLALILLIGYLRGKYLLKGLLSSMGEFTIAEYKSLSINAIVMLFSIAILNEIIWRNFSTSTWISFKTFGIPVCMFLFVLANIRTIMRASERKDSYANKKDKD